jgi:hypothetical protein
VTLIKPRTASFVLYQGDDMARLAELKRAADQAAGGSRMDDGADEAAEYEAFLDEAAERAVEVAVQAIGRRRWRDLVMAHPSRMVESEPDDEGKTRMVEHDDDVQWGVNTETFPRALLTYVDPEKPETRTLVNPSLSGEELGEFVDDDLSEGDFEKAWITAFGLNASPSRDPKDHARRSSESTT